MDKLKNLEQLISMMKVGMNDTIICTNYLEDFLKDNHYDKSFLEQDEFEWKLKPESLKLVNFWKRIIVKTMFSNIEGVLFAMKRLILEDIEGKHGFTITSDVLEEFHTKSKLSINDIIKLQEYKLVGPDEINLEEIPVFIPILENIRFTLSKYALVRTNNHKTNFDCKGWDCFKISVEIRNRITHPKDSEDLNISNKEFKVIQDAQAWFWEILKELQKNEIN